MEQSEQLWHLGEDFLNSAFNCVFKIFQIKMLKKGRRDLGMSQAHQADVGCHPIPITTPPMPGTKAPWEESPVGRDGRDPSSEGLCESARLTGLPWWLNNKESTWDAEDSGDLGSIPGSRRSPGEGNDYPLQYSCLENPMGRGAWWATVLRAAKSQTRWKQLSMHALGWLAVVTACYFGLFSCVLAIAKPT